MTPRNNLPNLLIGASMLAAIALAGCSSSKDDGTGMPLTIPAGLAASAAGPIYATDEDDTVAMLLPDSNNQFAPLSSGLQRDFEGQTSSLADDFHVKTISSDGAGGLTVAYVFGGEERTVHFGADDFDTADCRNCYYVEDDEGRKYWFGKYYEEVTYADVYGGTLADVMRSFFNLRSANRDRKPSHRIGQLFRTYVYRGLQAG